MSEVWELYDKWLYVTNPESVFFGKRACVRQAGWKEVGAELHEYCPHLEVEGHDSLLEHMPTNDITFLELMDHIPKDKLACATLKLMLAEKDPLSFLDVDDVTMDWDRDKIRVALLTSAG